jgi:hypothetical protein
VSVIRFLSILVLASAWCTAARGQVVVGNVTLTLGESQSSAMKKLNAEYRVDSAGFVWQRGGPPFKVIGAVGFKGGRLSFLNRSWDLEPRDERSILQAVVRSLSQLAEPRGSSCTVEASRVTEPSSDQEQTTITCGNHSIVISVGSVAQEVSAGISETWILAPR